MSVEEAGRARWLRDHPAERTRTVYISIGNSDDRLTQNEWSLFVANVRHMLSCNVTATHGEWHSLPDAPFQNACFCVEFSASEQAEAVKSALANWAKSYRQESIAWADAETEFITPKPPPDQYHGRP